jgi:uridine kinase
MKFIHIQVNMQYNENSYGWNDPKVREDFNFSIPVDALDAKALALCIANTVKSMGDKFPIAVAEYEAKQAEELAKKEAEVDA